MVSQFTEHNDTLGNSLLVYVMCEATEAVENEYTNTRILHINCNIIHIYCIFLLKH